VGGVRVRASIGHGNSKRSVLLVCNKTVTVHPYSSVFIVTTHDTYVDNEGLVESHPDFETETKLTTARSLIKVDKETRRCEVLVTNFTDEKKWIKAGSVVASFEPVTIEPWNKGGEQKTKCNIKELISCEDTTLSKESHCCLLC
jgi:hypothetical protein